MGDRHSDLADMAQLKHYVQSVGFWMLMAYVVGVGTFLYLRHEDNVQTEQIAAQAHTNCVGQNDVRQAITNILLRAREGSLSGHMSNERRQRVEKFYDAAIAELTPRDC